MIRNELQNKELYISLEPITDAAGYYLIELSEHEKDGNCTIHAVIQSKNGNTSINDCTKVHRLIFPRIELLRESRDVYLEVSTPGIQRVLKDAAEFRAFVGKPMRILTDQDDDWIDVELFQVTENSIMITTKQDEQRELPFRAVRKAKLVYNWEDRK